MTPKALALAFLGLVGSGFATVGCGSGGQKADAAPRFDADAGDAGDGDQAGDAENQDASDAAPKPAPVGSAGSRLVVAGDATLVGQGLDACTNAPSPTGDRWCAFGRAAGDYYELWVIDVTKAAGGTAVACDGTDANCLRLTSRLYKNRLTGFVDSGFNGDTLVYGEARFSGASTGAFEGVLSAWRPGWTAGRAVTSDSGLYCVGHARSDAVMCFENRNGDGVTQDVTVDLLAGDVSPDSSVLPKMDTLLLVSTTDAPGTPMRVQFDLSPDGEYVAWSTRTAADPLETLRASRLDAAGQATVVAKDVTQWAMSPDGAAWYWLAGYNHDVAGAPSGTLQTAAFPAGGGPTVLATNVGDYAPAGASSLWLRTDVAQQVGTLRWMADRAAPAGATTVDTGVLAVLDHARDGSRLLYAKSFVPIRPPPDSLAPAMDALDLYVGSPSGGAPCVVTASPESLHATVAPAGDVVVWDKYDVASGETSGFATTVASCVPALFATRLAKVLPAGDTGYVYLDDADVAAGEGTLRYAPVVNGALAAGTPPIQTRAAMVFAPLQPALGAVAYTVNAGTPADGLYLYLGDR
jgi:hypothetical protein